MLNSRFIKILALLSISIFTEFITGSTTIIDFLNFPYVIIIFGILYGIPTLLIRELKIKWNLQWSIIFLTIAFAIFIEGFYMQSFFNLGHEDLGILSNYGTFLGIQTIWTIQLIIFHSLVSILIPIFFFEKLFPNSKKERLIGIRGLIISILALTSLIIYYFNIIKIADMYANYTPNPITLSLTFLIMCILIYLAYKFKDSKLVCEKLPLNNFLLFIFGILFIVINQFTPIILANLQILAVITFLIQILFIITIYYFIKTQIYSKNSNSLNVFSIIAGLSSFQIIIFILLEFFIMKTNPQVKHMSFISLFTTIILIIFYYKIKKNSNILN